VAKVVLQFLRDTDTLPYWAVANGALRLRWGATEDVKRMADCKGCGLWYEGLLCPACAFEDKHAIASAYEVLLERFVVIVGVDNAGCN
jgi:hypothetical protein